MNYPIENRFRKPVELVSSVVALIAAGVLWSHPRLFLVTPVTGRATTFLPISLALWRGRQGYRLLRFQRKLRRLPQYTIAASEIPCPDTEVFLGRGFRWTALHTQRLYQARLPENRH